MDNLNLKLQYLLRDAKIQKAFECSKLSIVLKNKICPYYFKNVDFTCPYNF